MDKSDRRVPSKRAQLIMKIRSDTGLTQVELSKLLGVTQCSLSYWENDTKDMSLQSFQKIHKFCLANKIKINIQDYL